ncbi:hypothetical protein DSO57_1036072 [Entomophthora muscae]|uniref:Uncharacterized protein n=1 Tax=Entomophthora muscae TaxID=34485 RepID=A0ACC2UK57_9FUNG|nr:hypothetical protein DSO57_1036072 [Entomophthora muscae]
MISLVCGLLLASLVASVPEVRVQQSVVEETLQNEFLPRYIKPSSWQGGFDIEEMLLQVNRMRAEAGANPLRINKWLMVAAHRHSQDQARSRRMSHVGSDGSSLSTRSMRVNYDYRAIAENVAYNQRSVSEVMNSWMNSPGHYANIINPYYQEFGAGMVDYYWTQNFGTSQQY